MTALPTVRLLDLLAAIPWPVWNEVPSTAKIEALSQELIELNTKGEVIQALADKEGRAMSEDERKELKALADQFKSIEEEIEQRREVLNQSNKLTQSLGRQTTPEGPETEEHAPSTTAPTVRNQAPESKPRKQTRALETIYTNKGKWGWDHPGQFYNAVREASSPGTRTIDPRLTIRDAALSTYGSEGVDTDGGYAVPPDFRPGIIQMIVGEDSLLARTDQLTTTSNSITVPVDETTPWQTSGGIQVYMGAEAGVKTQSKLTLQERRVGLHKMYALVPVTDELLEDVNALGAYIGRKVPQKMQFKVNSLILRGNGAGEPLGIMNSPALVSVPKESGQLADTIETANLLKMYSRMYAPSRSSAVWLINQDIEPQLFQLTMGINSMPVYLPPNGLSQAPYATILGRPVIATQACETLGDQGDIIFADLSQYMSVVKGGGIKQDVSIHLWFDQDVTAFRFVMRIGGQPWWSTSVSPRDGNTTLSPFVTLDARA